MNKLISVVILNWNGEKLLQKFLPLVIANSTPDYVEIVVADNASTDNSIELLRTNFPEVKIIQLDKNYGFSGGYNRALQQIETQYTLLLNSDVAPGENWIPPLYSYISQNETTAIVVPKIKSFENPQQFEYAGAAGGHIDILGYPFCKGRIFDSIEYDRNQYNRSTSIFWASGAAFLISTQLYNQVGGLDEDFFAHMEEIDLCWRLKNYGYKIQYIPESEIFHLGGGTLPYNNPNKVYLNFRNNLFLILKNNFAQNLFLILFLRMILDGVAFFHFLIKREFRNATAVFIAHIHFYKNAGKMWQKRKFIQQHSRTKKHPEILHNSIVFQYFILKRKKFLTIVKEK